MRQASHHEPDHGEVDPGFFTAWKHFIILGKPAPGGKPRERALHNPTPFEDVKATWPNLLPIDDGILWSPDPAQAAPGVLNDLHLPPERLLDPLDKAAFLVCTVGPDQLESRKAALERFQELLAAYGILDIGFMHEHV